MSKLFKNKNLTPRISLKITKRLGEISVKTGKGWDLSVSSSGPLPPQSISLSIGTSVEYYWNEEWEWQKAKVVGKTGPVAGEYLFDLEFESDGEIHRCAFGFKDRARWRPV